MQFPKIENIYKAKSVLSKVVKTTPFEKNDFFSNLLKADVFFKREDLQQVRSFKIRGAFYKMFSLTPKEKELGIICASAGNHAQGVAFACKYLKIKGKIYMPVTTPKQKVSRVGMFGDKYVDIILVGDSYDKAEEIAIEESKKTKQVFIHAFDDKNVIEGQGTIALEILEQQITELDYLFVPIGGGGLIAGIITVFKELSPNTKIIGIEAEGAVSMKISIEQGKLIKLKTIDNFVDGVAVKKAGKISYEICSKNLEKEDIITVHEGQICQTILDLYTSEGIVVEPAGAIGLAALKEYKKDIQGKKVGVIICGGNNDIMRMSEIKERALLYGKLKHYFIVHFSQRSGALKEFVTKILGADDDITFFEYRKKSNRQTASALIGIELKNVADFQPLLKKMKKYGFLGEYLNDKPHLFQYLI